MRVSDSRRVLFVHVPKTGGSTIDLIFDREVADARQVDGRARHTPYRKLVAAEPVLATYWSFGFVRNPWARMVSWWSMVAGVIARYEAGNPKAVAKVEAHPTVWHTEGKYGDDFDAFVLRGTAEIPKLARPQLRTLGGLRRGVDFVGRTENFAVDVARVREHLGLEPMDTPPRTNRSRHGPYQEYFNDRTRQRVAEVFADDIEAFGYRFE